MFAFPIPDYETHPRYRDVLPGIDDALRQEAMARFLPAFEACYRRHLGAPRLNYDGRIEAGDELLRQLQTTGCAAAALPAGPKARLVELATPIAREIDDRLGEGSRLRFRDTQRLCDPETHAELYGAVEEALEAEHVHAAASAYVGRPLALREVTIQVNTDRLTAAQYGALDACGLPSPRTRYFHIDSAIWPPVKVLIYLTPVGPDQGPFRYVEGSHRLAGDFELMVRKVNDRELMPDDLFMALPPAFRANTLFGDHMDPAGEAADRLLARERAYDDGADLILFDFNGAHRGGFVREGRRWLLQCHFEPRSRRGK